MTRTLLTRTVRRRRLLGATVVAASLALVAACGGSSAPTASPAGVDHNDADIAFATDMVPHHAQAVEMADMAVATSKNTEIVALATSIKAAQEPEIKTLTGFLRDWAAPAPTTGSEPGGDHSAGGSMSSMMSDGEMAELGKAMGTAFDTMWLDMMTRHHEGAIEMSKTEQAKGASAPAKALAQQIIDAQTTEIATMKQIKVG